LFRHDNWTASGDVYVCDNQNDLNIISPETAVVTSSNGIHVNNNLTSKHVTAYLADSRHMEYFPRGLVKIYQNLRAFYIQKCDLRMIRQSDIKVFPDLVELNLGHNKIDALEDDLFSFNLVIKYILFSGNPIKHIGMKVFDNLNLLSYLFLNDASCIDTNAKNSTSLVKSVIKMTKSNCYNSDYVAFHDQVYKIHDPLICVNSILENSLKKLNDSKFARFELLKPELEFISKNKQNWCINERFEAIEKSVTMKNLRKDQQEIEKVIKNIVVDYINDKVEKRLSKLESAIDKLVKSLEKLNATEFGEENGKRFKDLEGNLNQVKIRMVLIGTSALLVTLVIAIGICKVMK